MSMSTKIRTSLTILDHTILQYYNFNIALYSPQKNITTLLTTVLRTAIKLIQCSVTNGSELILRALSEF